MSKETWVVKHKAGYGTAATFRTETEARDYIEKNQGRDHALWHKPMELRLTRGRDYGKHVYRCWDCDKLFDSIAHMKLPNLDFHEGICHGCVLKIAAARAFSSWSE